MHNNILIGFSIIATYTVRLENCFFKYFFGILLINITVQY
jgi:hypothetical protein